MWPERTLCGLGWGPLADYGTRKDGNKHQQMHIYSHFNNLKFTLKHLKRSYMFRSYDHPEGAYIVPC